MNTKGTCDDFDMDNPRVNAEFGAGSSGICSNGLLPPSIGTLYRRGPYIGSDAGLQSRGMQNLSIDQLVNMRIHGID